VRNGTREIPDGISGETIIEGKPDEYSYVQHYAQRPREKQKSMKQGPLFSKEIWNSYPSYLYVLFGLSGNNVKYVKGIKI
jgi:hypothetical protein